MVCSFLCCLSVRAFCAVCLSVPVGPCLSHLSCLSYLSYLSCLSYLSYLSACLSCPGVTVCLYVCMCVCVCVCLCLCLCLCLSVCFVFGSDSISHLHKSKILPLCLRPVMLIPLVRNPTHGSVLSICVLRGGSVCSSTGPSFAFQIAVDADGGAEFVGTGVFADR